MAITPAGGTLAPALAAGLQAGNDPASGRQEGRDASEENPAPHAHGG